MIHLRSFVRARTKLRTELVLNGNLWGVPWIAPRHYRSHDLQFDLLKHVVYRYVRYKYLDRSRILLRRPLRSFVQCTRQNRLGGGLQVCELSQRGSRAHTLGLERLEVWSRIGHECYGTPFYDTFKKLSDYSGVFLSLEIISNPEAVIPNPARSQGTRERFK